MTQINPYLTFNGNCKDAFNFYQSIFGGEFAYVKRYDEMPEEYQVDEADKSKVMNIALPINDTCTLLGNDANPAMGSVEFGKNITLSVNAATKEQADDFFNKLSIGGMVFMPMGNMFWGDYFGMCEDKFGMNWMVNFHTKQQS